MGLQCKSLAKLNKSQQTGEQLSVITLKLILCWDTWLFASVQNTMLKEIHHISTQSNPRSRFVYLFCIFLLLESLANARTHRLRRKKRYRVVCIRYVFIEEAIPCGALGM